MTAHGIPTVTLGCGQMQIHTTSESLDLAAFDQACAIALDLAYGGQTAATRDTTSMELDDELCLCFHVTKRKVINFIRVEKPPASGQLSECFGAGTGCGWCRTYLKRLFESHGSVESDSPDPTRANMPRPARLRPLRRRHSPARRHSDRRACRRSRDLRLAPSHSLCRVPLLACPAVEIPTRLALLDKPAVAPTKNLPAREPWRCSRYLPDGWGKLQWHVLTTVPNRLQS